MPADKIKPIGIEVLQVIQVDVARYSRRMTPSILGARMEYGEEMKEDCTNIAMFATMKAVANRPKSEGARKRPANMFVRNPDKETIALSQTPTSKNDRLRRPASRIPPLWRNYGSFACSSLSLRPQGCLPPAQ